jgi:VWFA-related protein
MAGAEEPPSPAESALKERVTVQLAEVKILVTDRAGKAITDLRPDELRVVEGGVEQKVAYLGRLSQRVGGSSEGQGPPPAPLYTADGRRVESDATAVLPPRAVRRVILAFDVRNGRRTVRDDWREAALGWATGSMQSGDQAGVVVFRTYPDWVLRLTADRDAVVAALTALRLEGSAPNRDRREELTRLLDEIRGLCTGAGELQRRPRRASPTDGASRRAGSEEDCSSSIVRPYVEQWAAESNESIQVLRTLTGELAAVPGQKTVVLFSEGIIPDAADAGIGTMLAVFGAGTIDFRDLGTRLKADAYAELTGLHRAAAAADVAYFTFDTRSAAEGSSFANLEQSAMLSTRSLALNPWSEMYEATRSTLAGLAAATGGRSFYGRDRLVENVGTAVDGFFGIYTLGYYRSDPAAEAGRLRITVQRRRARLSYRSRPELQLHRVSAAPLDLMIGQPRSSGRGERQWLPVAVQAPMPSLPLRRGVGGHGCQIGVFVQAVRPDGTVDAESFELATAFVPGSERHSPEHASFRHELRLELPPGAYRIRARISDDRQEVVGDRSIDLTLRAGAVEPGLGEAARAPGSS